MTKKLTEQWREGTLPQGNYYIVIRGIEKEQMMIDYYIPELHHFEIKPSECIKEVLAPVPSYDEIKRLQERLEIATKALEELETKSDKFDNSWSIQGQLDFIKAKCQETLYQIKEMEGVK